MSNFPTTFNLDNEVNKFNLNDYVNKNSNNIYLSKMIPDEDDFDKDDLLYTNAIRDDSEGDKFDKARYIVDNILYLNVDTCMCSSSTSGTSGTSCTSCTFIEESMNSTGNLYTDNYVFMPYTSMTIDVTDNMIYFKVINKKKSVELVNYSNNTNLFSVSIDRKTYTILTLQSEIENKMNDYLYNNSVSINNDQLSDTGSPHNIFSVSVINNPDIDDPRLLIITITSTTLNYNFVCQFSEFGQDPILNCGNDNILFTLQSPINNVKSIRIVSSHIINNDTFINMNNNIVSISLESLGLWYYIVPNYDYTIDTLLQNMINGLNVIINTNTGYLNYLSYSYDTLTGIINIYKDPIYITDFKLDLIKNDKIKSSGRNIFQMLGFNKSNMEYFSSSFSNMIIKSSIVNGSYMTYETSYSMPCLIKSSIWVDFNSYETIFDVKNNYWRFNRFCIYNDEIDLQFQPICTLFEIPVKLETLNIKFYDDDAIEYKDIKYWFMLEIIYQGDRLVATNINTKRDQFKI